MLSILLVLGLSGAQVSTQQTAQFSPCSWPNKCEQISTCQFPNPCLTQVETGISTCDFPKKCG